MNTGLLVVIVAFFVSLAWVSLKSVIDPVIWESGTILLFIAVACTYWQFKKMVAKYTRELRQEHEKNE